MISFHVSSSAAQNFEVGILGGDPKTIVYKDADKMEV